MSSSSWPVLKLFTMAFAMSEVSRLTARSRDDVIATLNSGLKNYGQAAYRVGATAMATKRRVNF